jgi:hypothetical protein
MTSSNVDTDSILVGGCQATSNLWHRLYLFLSALNISCQNVAIDFEGKGDDKIKTLEVVEELRTKRADMQVSPWKFTSNSLFLWTLDFVTPQINITLMFQFVVITVFSLLQATLLLDAFNKDRASLPQPIPAPQITPVQPPAPPDARTQEMINEKLKKAEELGMKWKLNHQTAFIY